ncbi:hypothetical protein M0P65_05940 [Candidatus Gracilibacteria bacterium]|jgi:DNA-directed RNA polymerase beta' subunit|nr:hypothetical protein [Candidatus Gracilibacteria bacterium]
MEITKKALTEIESLKSKKEELEKEKLSLQQKIDLEISKKEWKYVHFVRKEQSKIFDKIFNTENKIELIEKRKISSSEWNKIKTEALNSFTTISTEKSIGMSSVIKIGYSKTILQWIEVDITKYSSFMSNVRGCGSLANKKELNSITVLTLEQYNEKLGGTKEMTTSFMGTTTKQAPIIVGY